MSAEQEALDRVLITWAGAPADVVADHLAVAWSEVGAGALDDATKAAWTERLSAGFRVVLPLECTRQPGAAAS